jgi:hypothetical protein
MKSSPSTAGPQAQLQSMRGRLALRSRRCSTTRPHLDRQRPCRRVRSSGTCLSTPSLQAGAAATIYQDCAVLCCARRA